jgi:hypothetical protein
MTQENFQTRGPPPKSAMSQSVARRIERAQWGPGEA